MTSYSVSPYTALDALTVYYIAENVETKMGSLQLEYISSNTTSPSHLSPRLGCKERNPAPGMTLPKLELISGS